MSKPGSDGYYMPLIRFAETMALWWLASLATIVCGILLIVWGMLLSPLFALWCTVSAYEALYVMPRLKGWNADSKRLHAMYGRDRR
jgi:hypothetical protein